METLRDRVNALSAIGISFAAMARMMDVDRSLISKFANGKTNLGLANEAKLLNVIDEIKEKVRNV